MKVLRIVPNVRAADSGAADAFYREPLGLRVAMDRGWIRTYAAEGRAAPQISFAAEGGSGIPVPDTSIEVDDFDQILRRVMALGAAVEYGLVIEPWGVRRFFVRDPFGRLVDILAHDPRDEPS